MVGGSTLKNVPLLGLNVYSIVGKGACMVLDYIDIPWLMILVGIEWHLKVDCEDKEGFHETIMHLMSRNKKWRWFVKEMTNTILGVEIIPWDNFWGFFSKNYFPFYFFFPNMSFSHSIRLKFPKFSKNYISFKNLNIYLKIPPNILWLKNWYLVILA